MVETAIIIILLVILSLALLFLFIKKDVRLTVANKELAQEDKQFVSIMEGMLDGLLVIDSNFKIIFVNPATFTVLGIKKKVSDVENNDINIFDIVNSFGGKYRLDEAIADIFERGVSTRVPNVYVADKLIELVLFPIDIEDATRNVGIVFHDRSEETEIQKLRDEFTAMIIHELRSPLTVIQSTSDVLLKRTGELDEERIKTLLSQIKNSTGNLLGIVNDLLDTAKLESGKFKIKKEIKDINNLLQEESKHYTQLAKNKNITLKLDLNTNIEPFSFDYYRITQLMNNLLSNAIKFTENGEIIIKSDSNDGSVIVSVSDTGFGISEEEKVDIFKKFAQTGKKATNNEKGTGLGLVISRGIVEAHGGDIWVENNVPSGSKFIFRLPI